MKRTDLLPFDLTQTELATKMGVTQPLISNWLNGKVIPRPDTLKKLSEATKIPMNELIKHIYSKHETQLEANQ